MNSPKTNKFKVGDRVKFIAYSDETQWEKCYGVYVGDIFEVATNGKCDLSIMTLKGYKVYVTEEQLESVETPKQMYTPLGVQQNGTHYKIKGIQPIEYTLANDLSFAQGNIVKYVTRHQDKNGLDDLAKSIHYHFFEALRVYGEQGSTELKEKVLKLLGVTE
jgi:hypothetical protein